MVGYLPTTLRVNKNFGLRLIGRESNGCRSANALTRFFESVAYALGHTIMARVGYCSIGTLFDCRRFVKVIRLKICILFSMVYTGMARLLFCSNYIVILASF